MIKYIASISGLSVDKWHDDIVDIAATIDYGESKPLMDITIPVTKEQAKGLYIGQKVAITLNTDVD